MRNTTQLLISVTNVAESDIALLEGADIIDLKNPHQGALGALSTETIQSIVTHVKACSPNTMISATIGDVPMLADQLTAQVLKVANTGVDIVKIGFFAAQDYNDVLQALQNIALGGVKLVAVLFAECTYPVTLISEIQRAQFIGVMIDTAEKNGRCLTDCYSLQDIERFSNQAQSCGLIYGFAGSLKFEHVAGLVEYRPTYLGFRGGVCEGNERRMRLAPLKIRSIKKLLTQN